MPEEKGGGPLGDARHGNAEEPELYARAKALRAALAQAAGPEARRVRGQLEKCSYRASNQFVIQALDNALRQGMGLDLQFFSWTDAPRPLLPGERFELWQEEVLAGAGLARPDQLRLVVVHEASGRWQRAAPTQAGSDGVERLPPSLHICIDRSGCQLPGAMWLYGEGIISGTVTSDLLHNDWNAFKAANTMAGTWMAVLEQVLVCNMPSGPWGGGKFFANIKESAKEMFQEMNAGWPVFGLLFKRVCSELDDYPPDFGSSDHMKRVWERCKASKCLARKGPKIRMGRWWQWIEAMQEKQAEMTVLCMVLLYKMLKEGTYNDLEASPLGKNFRPAAAEGPPRSGAAAASSSSSAPVPVVAPTTAAGAERVAMAESNRLIQQARGSTKNSMDLACRLLCNDAHVRLCNGIRALSWPLFLSFKRWVAQLHTQVGTLELFMSFATGENQTRTCDEVLAAFRGEAGDSFHKVDFLQCGAAGVGEVEKERDRMVARRMFVFAVSMCGFRLTNQLEQMYSLPGRFLLLLHSDGRVRAAALASLQLMHGRVAQLEEAAATDREAKDLVNHLWWPKLVWCRSIMALLAEAQWSTVPLSVKSEVERVYLGIMTTEPVENMFNHLRGRERQCTRGVVSRRARWQSVLHSQVLEKADRPLLPASPQAHAAVAGRKLSNEVFCGDSKDNSLTMKKLAEVTTSTRWTSFGPEAWRGIGCLNAALLEHLEDGDKAYLGRLSRLWLSELPPVGSGIWFGDNYAELWLVLHVTAYGGICWRLQGARRGDFRFLVPAAPATEDGALCPWKVFHVTNLKQVQCVDLMATPPVDQAATWKQAAPGGIVLQLRGAKQSLRHMAAGNAFRPLSLPRLRELSRMMDMGIPNLQSLREPDLVKALVLHCRPGITEEALQKILELRERRGQQKEEALESELYSADDAVVEEVLQQDDLEVVQQARQHAKAPSKLGPAAVAAAWPGAASTVPEAPAPAAAARPKVSLKGSATPEDVKALLPPAVGASVVLDVTRHMRWGGRYPARSQRPYSYSRAFGAEEKHCSRAEALRSCIEWLWQVHQEEGGKAPDFDLEV